MSMNDITLTLLLSQRDLPAGWQEALVWPGHRLARVDLFCLAQATHLLHNDFSALPPGRRVFCAHTHRLQRALHPLDHSPFEAGGLATLGGMVRDSHGTVSLPHSHWPREKGEPGVKDIGIFLGDELDTLREAIRLATGLAGCNHAVTLYSAMEPFELRMLLPETAPLLNALAALGAEFKMISPDDPPGNHSILLQL